MEIRVRGYKKSYKAGYNECNELWEEKIKNWIQIINKDIEENKKRKFTQENLKDGSTKVSICKILYTPIQVRLLLEDLLKEKGEKSQNIFL